MSLDKAIKYGKEKRKPYTRSKVIDSSCRNRGSYPYCAENHLHKFKDKHPMAGKDYKNTEQDNEDIDVDKILYWKENPDVFIEEVFGLKLYPSQKILLRGLDNGNGGKVYDEIPLCRRYRW